MKRQVSSKFEFWVECLFNCPPRDSQFSCEAVWQLLADLYHTESVSGCEVESPTLFYIKPSLRDINNQAYKRIVNFHSKLHFSKYLTLLLFFFT